MASSDQQQQQATAPREDVGPFVRAVAALGFEHRETDGANKMFVVMTFTRKRDEESQKKSRKKKQRNEDEGGDGQRRLVGGRGGWPSLRPCSYKKR